MIKNIDNKDFLDYLVNNDILNFNNWLGLGEKNDIKEYNKIEFKHLLYGIYYKTDFTTTDNSVRSKAGSLDISILNTYISEKRNKKLESILDVF